MRETLFTIPYQIDGVPLFGFGVLLALWVGASVVWLAWSVKKHGLRSETLGFLPFFLLVAAGIVVVTRIFPDGLPIRGYGVMLLLGVLAGLGLATHRARQMGVDPEIISSLALWLFVGGIVGARLFHVIEFWESDYRKDSFTETVQAILNVPRGGLVVYGSLIGAGIVFLLFVRRHKLPALALADLIAPSLVLGLALGRVGCLMNGCCFGGSCELPWAVTFPPESPPYKSQLARGEFYGLEVRQDSQQGAVRVHTVTPGSPAATAGLKPGDRLQTVNGFDVTALREVYGLLAQAARDGWKVNIETGDGRQVVLPAQSPPARSLPVHPTQIYSAINAGLLCLLLVAFYPFRRRDGEVLALLLTVYPITRLLIEIIRTDELGVLGTGLTISQNVSLLIFVAVAMFWIYLARQPLGSALPAGPAQPARVQ